MSKKKSAENKTPSNLINELEQIIRQMGQKMQPDISPDKVLQFNEISKTIDRLKENGAKVPDELRMLKIELSYDAEKYQNTFSENQEALDSLQDIEIKLNNTLAFVRTTVSRLKGTDTNRKKTKRYVKRTSPTILAKETRKALRELGGSGKKADVLEIILKNMDGKFKHLDLERDSSGVLNWERWVVAEKNKMTKEGKMTSGSGFGVWELRGR
ncbi:MAG: hypothetical protein HQK65_15885 [Desulfamplus sp.]|nr:hypothetical protein [Desulfamplus sp.]